MTYVPGYSVTMRQDRKTGEYLAFVPTAYTNHHGERYYMALTLMDGWVELTPEYAVNGTRNVTEYPEALKRYMDHQSGYILHVAPRLYRR